MKSLFTALALVLLIILPAAAQTTNLEDEFGVMDVGNGKVRVQRRGGDAGVELNLVKAQHLQKGRGFVHVQVADPGGKGAGQFRYNEVDGTFDTNANGKALRGKLNEDGTVTIGNVTCDARKDNACVVAALANFLQQLEVTPQSVAAMRHALKGIDSTNMTRGNEIQQTFKLLVRELAQRTDARAAKNRQ